MISLPLMAYTSVQEPESVEIARGFGAAALLLVLVLVLFAIARRIGGRGPGQLSRGQQRRRAAASRRDADRYIRRERARHRQSPSPRSCDESQTVLRRARGPGPGRAVRGRALRRLRLIALILGLAFTFAAVELGAVPFAPVPPPPAAAAILRADHRGRVDLGVPGDPRLDRQREPVRDHGQLPPNGSSSGRTFFADGQADWAASEIPYGVVDGTNTDPPPSRGYVYMPDVAGGTTFMYNLQINGQRVTNLRLSGATIAGIFTNKITTWNDPAIAADNPGLTLPATCRSSRSSARTARAPPRTSPSGCSPPSPRTGQAYCAAVGRTPCTQTSTYPVQAGTAMIGQSGDPGVAGYVSAGLVERRDRLRRVLLRAAGGLPGREGAQRGRLLHRAVPRPRRRLAARRPRSTPNPATRRRT